MHELEIFRHHLPHSTSSALRDNHLDNFLIGQLFKSYHDAEIVFLDFISSGTSDFKSYKYVGMSRYVHWVSH